MTTTPATSPARRFLLAATSLALAATLTSCGHTADNPGPRPAPSSVPSPTASRTAAPEPPAVPATPPARLLGRAPAELTFLASGTHVAVDPVSTRADGSLGIPEDVSHAGWWSPGAAPADRHGTTVLVGHVDSATQGLGSFYALWHIRPGMRVSLVDAGGRHVDYVVISIATYPKDEVPFADLFTEHGAPRLALITCAEPYIRARGGYQNNLVVLARPAQG